MPKASVNGIEIEYAVDGPDTGSAFLLFMGAGEQLIMWPQALIDALTRAGHRVVRFDYRDTGLSTTFDAAGPVDLQALVEGLMAGRPGTTPYAFSDMVADAIGLLDHLGIARAHVLGLSLGGMLAQTFALSHPDRVLSLTSIASTTGDLHLPPPNPGAVMQMFAVPPGSPPQAWIEARVQGMTAMQGSRYRATPQEIRSAAEHSVRRSLVPAGVTRQIGASILSPPRGEALWGLRLPALVLHGTDDTIIAPACGTFTAQCIPGATFVVFEGMGHGFSEDLMEVWSPHIVAIARKADAS